MDWLIGHDEYVFEYVMRNLEGETTEFANATSVGLLWNGRLIAGCVYRNNYGHDVEMIFAATDKRWATKSNIRAFFWYPFIQLGVSRITAVVGRKNKAARDFVERLGFKHEGTLRKGLDGKQDAIIYGILYNECKWLGVMNDGQKIGTKTH